MQNIHGMTTFRLYNNHKFYTFCKINFGIRITDLRLKVGLLQEVSIYGKLGSSSPGSREWSYFVPNQKAYAVFTIGNLYAAKKTRIESDIFDERY